MLEEIEMVAEQEIIEGYRLSPQQEHVWNLLRENAGVPVAAQAVVRLEGTLREEDLKAALCTLVNRHEILRTTFEVLPGMTLPLQVIGKEGTVSLRRVSLDMTQPIEPLLREERERLCEMPVRFLLLALQPGVHLLVFTISCLCGDARSLRNMVQEVASFYGSSAPDVPAETIQYADISEWQNELVESPEAAAAFCNRNAREEQRSVLALERSHASARRGWETIECFFDRDLEQFSSLASRCSVSVSTLLLGCWQILLSRHTLQSEITVGLYCENRNVTDLGRALGPLAKVIPATVSLSPELSFQQSIQRVSEVSKAIHECEELFSWNGTSALNGSSHRASSPYLFVFESEFITHDAGILKFELQSLRTFEERYKLKLLCRPLSGRLFVALDYDSSVFEYEAAAQLLSQLECLAESGIDNPDLSISSLRLLSRSGEERLLRDWNYTQTSYGHQGDIARLFELQAARTPEAIAVVLDSRQITYAELNDQADHIAAYLERNGSGPEQLVAVCLERSPELVAALLGVLKTGAAYVPLDPSYPPERLRFMLEDSRADVLVTQERLLPLLSASAPKTVCLDRDWHLISAHARRDRVNAVASENLAYVIYTSGSTGKPKGVMISQRSILNRLWWTIDRFGFSAEDSILQKTAFSFDASVWEIFVPLLSGARIVMAKPGGQQDSGYMQELIRAEGIGYLQLVPSMLASFLQEPEVSRCAGILKRVFSGGEALASDLVRRFHEKLPGVALQNLYGPTEASIDATSWSCEDPAEGPYAPLGRPLANVRVYVVDENLELLPPGISGEIYIAGIGLARGYWQRPDLTAERFLPDPFSRNGERIYKTGDLGRYRSDGVIEYLGRIDHQVKLRGYRIELGEIEAVLAKRAEIRQCVAMVREDEPGDRRLVAYVVFEDEARARRDPAALRRELSTMLPEYMVPGIIVALDALPLSPNGKLDRGALPKPEVVRTIENTEPRTLTEQILARIWSGVLNVERDKVGILSSFFELGGHSLLATQLITRVRDIFRIDIPLKTLFDHPVLREFGEVVDGLLRGGIAPLGRIPKIAGLSRRRLSYGQKRLWFLDRLEPDSAFYNLPAAVLLRGELDITALENALRRVIEKHESLRTHFEIGSDGELEQVIAPRVEVSIPIFAIGETGEEQKWTEVRRLAAIEAQRPFSLSTGPLFRAALLRLSELEHVALFTMHHIVSDGWSQGVFIAEIGAAYDTLVTGAPPACETLPIQYGDYADWQQSWLHGEALEKQVAFWREKLQGLNEFLDLPTDFPRPAVQRHRGAHFRFVLETGLSGELYELAGHENATLFMILLAAWQILLSRYSGQRDISVGVPIANRTQSETEQLIGFFVNTLLMRTELQPRESFRDLLKRVRECALAAYAHQDLPFEKLVEELHPTRDLSRSPLFQVMFALQNAPANELKLHGIRFQPLALESGISKFDLTLFVTETPNGALEAILEYSTDLFEESTIRRIGHAWENLLHGIVVDPDTQVIDLPLLDTIERQQILNLWNQTERDGFGNKNIVEVFEHQARKQPEAVAATFDGQQITYDQLNRKANRLARHLVGLDVRNGDVVALLTSRNLSFLVSMLGVWKTGAAYMPLDASHPEERLRVIVTQSSARCLVVDEQFRELAASILEGVSSNARPSLIDLSDLPALPACEGNPRCDIHPKDLAYVIFTSGSTGVPKGVLVEHAGMMNHLYAKVSDLGLRAGDKVAQTASTSFDISVWQFIAALLVGANVEIVASEIAAHPEQLWNFVREREVTVLEVVPSLLASLLQVLRQTAHEERLSLRWLLVTGEAVAPALTRAWMERYPETPLMNAYGPTECSDDVTHHVVEHADGLAVRVPIGRPVANTEIYVLDERGLPTPVGVPGEICVGGTAVGRGYLNQPARTAELFIPDPFGSPGARLYKTGDFGRYRADGKLECLGRLDDQVKVRGFRIELGEIESALLQYPDVREAVVVVVESGNEKRLTAYVVANDTGGSLPDLLTAHLRAKLPEYMVPAQITMLERMPLTANGKLNREALPKPEFDRKGGTALKIGTEEVVAQIWSQLLNIEAAGAHDNFFSLGGHSLLAAQVVSRIREVFQIEIPLRRVFEHPTVQGLSRVIDEQLRGGTNRGSSTIVRKPGLQRRATSYAQQRLWFLHQLRPGYSAYNLTSAIQFQGELDPRALESSLNKVIARHETLRARFEPSSGGLAEQVIAPELRLFLSMTEIQGENRQQRLAQLEAIVAQEAATPFDLSTGPLVRARLFRIDHREHVMVLGMHHIISDGWSGLLLREELAELYRAEVNGEEPILPELPIQYGDYAEWERETLEAESLRSPSAYRKHLEGMQGILELPADRTRPAVQTYSGAHRRLRWEAEIAAGVRRLAREESATTFMVLLASLQLLLSRYSGQADIPIGTPVANRTRPETEKLIGFFVNTLVMRTQVQAEESFRELLRRVRETALGAYANQDLPFEKLVEELKPERDLSRSPLFQVMLAFENMPPAERELPGLRWTALEVESHTAKFDLTFFLSDAEEGGFSGSVEYNTDLYEAETIERMVGHWEELLRSIVDGEERRVGELGLLKAVERRQLVEEWNATGREYSREQTLADLFEEQVRRTPQREALVYERERLTYQELNRRANEIAHQLQQRGAGAETLIGVCLERSVELVVALLGVLKAGAAYVPLDPGYPAERLGYMVADAGARLILTSAAVLQRIPELRSSGAETICLPQGGWGSAAENPPRQTSGENLAYVIYTSGSTGKPKGAMNRHAGIRNRLQWMQEAYGLGEQDRVLQKTPFSFDVSVWEFFWPLLTGARLVLAAPGGHRSSQYLKEVIQSEAITTMHFVPSLLQAFVEEPGIEQCRSLRRVLCSGEALGWELQEQFWARLGTVELHNLYGPTEASVDVTSWKCRQGEPKGSVPLGRPIANTQIYILDRAGEVVPAGVAGELCIGGAGLGRGYWRRPDLTAERFVPDGCSGRAGARLYRTGDRARWRADGVLEYLGRIDHQVKLRGQRIELGEIESVLAGYDGVREAVVVVRNEGGDNHLVAYLVWRAAAEGERDRQTVEQYLREKLPDYMVPAQIVTLEALPLTPNGKLDRKSLPAPQWSQPDSYTAPRTESEAALARIWEEVLKRNQVGIDDNFFSLGGDSIRSIQVRARAERAGLHFTVEDVFRYPTIRQLVTHLGWAGEQVRTEPFGLLSPQDRQNMPAGVEDAYPLAALQMGMLFHRELAPEEAMYHNVNSYQVRGLWQRPQFEEALRLVTARHPALRTAFDLHSYSEPLQLVYRESEFPFQEYDLRDFTAAEQDQILSEFVEQEKSRYFDLQRPPQLRFAVHRRTDDTFQFTLTENHALLDGWSLHSLLNETFESYFALLKGTPLPLRPPLQTTYRDFVSLERRTLASPEHRQFWLDFLEGHVVNAFPRFASTEATPQSRRVRYQRVDISEDLSGRLRQVAHSLGVPLRTVLLTAHSKVMSFLSGTDDILTGLAAHGRGETEDADRTLGLFLNMVPFRHKLRTGSWESLVRGVYSTEQESFPFRRYPLAAIHRDLGTELLFDSLFNFVHFHVVDDLIQSRDMDVLDFVKYEVTNYGLLAAFSVNAVTRQLKLELEIDESKLSSQQAFQIAGYYTKCLASIAEDPFACHAIDLLSTAERRQIVEEWNATEQDYRREQTLADLFEEQVQRTPQREALVYERERLTFEELNRRANEIAHELQRRGAGAETLIGVCLERSVELVVALLGVLKAGAAYVPLDPSYPAERLGYMVADAGARLILTSTAVLQRIPELRSSGAETICLEQGGWGSAAENLQRQTSAKNLAYLIYTSGSTGKPKAVMIAQRSAVLLSEWARAVYGQEEMASSLASTSICFDFSVFELWAVLLCGGTVVLVRNVLEIEAAAQPIRMINTVPSAMAELLRSGRWQQGIRVVNLGGEAVAPDLVERLCERGVERIFNLYGPSEDTTFSTYGRMEQGKEPTIGRPLWNTRVFIVDANLRPVPVGVAGEIYLGGEGLSRGYFQRPALTAERFVPNPFSRTGGERLYRTGDLGRYRADGEIEYLGRLDQQVKVRGFRIELGEVETVLRACPGVVEAAVTARAEHSTGRKELVGYVVLSDANAMTDGTELREYLLTKLPEHMVPVRIIQVKQMPFTSTGKLDRKALPELEGLMPVARREIVSPRTPTEAALVEMWQDALATEPIGVTDSFFALGGHSLIATTLMSRMRERFQIELSLRTFLTDANTIEALALLIEKAQQSRASGQASTLDDRIQALPRRAKRRAGHSNGTSLATESTSTSERPTLLPNSSN